VKQMVAVAALGLFLGAGGAHAQESRADWSRFPFVLDPTAPVITGPIDQRFFGTFCQPEPRTFCKYVVACKTLRDTIVRLEHLTMTDGGFLSGRGRFVLGGEQGQLAVAGRIRERGWARVAAAVPGLGRQMGDATLSNDGLRLTASVQGRSVVLRKDACNNRAPSVTLAAPFGPNFPFGQSIMLTGQIQDEDTTFPVERQVFTSNRQGLIPGTRTAGGRTLFTTALQPGPHRITFTVTDSGGLTGQGSLDLQVVNRPPVTPRIFLPAVDGTTLVAGAPVLLQGSGYDPDSGFLTGSALRWTARLNPNGVFVPLGTGNEVGTVFAAPADPVLIRLTAVDPTGWQVQAERQVRVIPSTGNAPPVVVIRQPNRLVVNGPPFGAVLAGEPTTFVADAWDAEDPPAALQVRWEFVALQGLGGSPDPSPPVPNPTEITGTLSPMVTFPVGPDAFYRVTFTATDSGGLTSSDSIEIAVRAEVIE
jgi:hypothetical protein